MEGRDGGVPCGEPMGEEGGLLAAGETSYHKWRRGRLLQVVCVLAPGEGSNAYGHAHAMRTPLMTSRDSPDRRRLRELYLHAWVARRGGTVHRCMSTGARRVRGGETAARGCADPGPGAGAAAA